jgi:hypothetical protein
MKAKIISLMLLAIGGIVLAILLPSPKIFFGFPSGQVYQTNEPIDFTFICPVVQTQFGNCGTQGGNSGDTVLIHLNNPAGVVIASGELQSLNCPMGLSCFHFTETFTQAGTYTLYGEVIDSGSLQSIYQASKSIVIEDQPSCVNECSAVGQVLGCFDETRRLVCSFNEQTGCFEIVVGSECPPATPHCQDGQCVPVCTPGNYCVGDDLKHQNADCSTTLIESCEFGCSDGACLSAPIPPPTACGDGFCDQDEDSTICPEDCDIVVMGGGCGDGTCDQDENILTCPADCSQAQEQTQNETQEEIVIQIDEPVITEKTPQTFCGRVENRMKTDCNLFIILIGGMVIVLISAIIIIFRR